MLKQYVKCEVCPLVYISSPYLVCSCPIKFYGISDKSHQFSIICHKKLWDMTIYSKGTNECMGNGALRSDLNLRDLKFWCGKWETLRNTLFKWIITHLNPILNGVRTPQLTPCTLVNTTYINISMNFNKLAPKYLTNKNKRQFV